jgi:hypothetical protein
VSTRTLTIHCFGRSTQTISVRTEKPPTIFRMLWTTDWVRAHLPLPPNLRLDRSDHGQPSDETSVRPVPRVMRFSTSRSRGPDDVPPILATRPASLDSLGVDPNGPNRQGGYQHRRSIRHSPGASAGALIDHAQVSQEPVACPAGRIWRPFSARVFSARGVEQLAAAMAAGVDDPARSRSRTQRVGAAREGRLQPRVR